MKNSKTSVLAGWAGRVSGLAIPLAFVLTAVTVLAPAKALAETRALKLHFVHTGERAEIPYKKNGRFLPEGLKKLNMFLRDWRRNEPTKMDPRLLDLVWQVNQSVGGRDYITVVSAYRSPATNSMLRSRSRGVAKTSQHMLGKAMDFYIPGVPLKKVRDTALRYQVGGVGYYPTSGSPFVHLDVGSVRHWPRLNRRELLAVFPKGDTIHMPSDGKPLPGYQQALAAYEARKAGGGSIMMASAAKPKSKSLFGMLFGGGADEEEDNSESSGRAVASAARPARAAPVNNKAAAPVVVPAAVPARAVPVEPEPQAIQVASLPARDVPMPFNAPRQAAAPIAAPAAVVEMTPQDKQAAQAAMAFAVPLPVQRPQTATEAMLAMAPPPVNTMEAQAFAAANGQTTPAVAQIIAAAQVDPAVNTEQQAAVMLANVPLPIRRPQMANAIAAEPMTAPQPEMMPEMMVASAVIPMPRPVQAPSASRTVPDDAIAQLLSSDDHGQTHTASISNAASHAALAPKPQQLAMIGADEKRQPQVQPQAQPLAQPLAKPVVNNGAMDTGVRTTAKLARADRSAVKPSAGAVVQPASAASEGAISTEPVSRMVQVSNPVLRNEALRKAPTVVYTAGFQQDLPSGNANRFTGNAVTFMSIAKFSKTN